MGELDFYVSRISDNIGRTPEGFLVCKDVVLARTGWQDYEVRDLLRNDEDGRLAEVLKEFGIDAGAGGTVQVYRNPAEVFRAATIASCEGKSITDSHPPGEQFVNPTNVQRLEYGHVENVRRGGTPLESGDEPLIGDLIVKREPLLSEIERGEKRELSCGYDYNLAIDGKRLVQRKIVINHVAVVPRGRAGAEARIKDAAPESQERKQAGSSSTGIRKETGKVTNLFKHLLGLGFKAYAADAETSPEKLAEAAEAIKGAKTAEKDAEPGGEVKPPVEVKKPAEEKPAPVEDKKPADDCRARYHAALDRMLDKHLAAAEDKRKAEDVDLDELADLFDEFFEEEGEEAEHQEGAESEGPEIDEDIEGFENASGFHPIRGSEGYKRSAAGEGRKKRRRAADQFIEPVNEEAAATPATDALEILRVLRPVVARSNDANVRRAFNAAHRQAYGTSRANGGGTYAAVAEAGHRRAADVAAGDPNTERNKRLQEHYDRQGAGEKVEVKK